MTASYALHKAEKVLEAFFVFSLIFSSDTMLPVLQNMNEIGIDPFFFRKISLIISFLLLICYVLTSHYFSGCRENFKKWQMRHSSDIKNLAVCLLFLGLSVIITRFKIKSFLEGMIIPFFIYLLMAFFKSFSYCFKTFFIWFTRIILCICAVSLFFYVFGTLLHLVPGFPMYYFNNGEWNSGTNYYYLAFINDWQTQTLGSFTMIRNIGIFMEAPGFAFVLLLDYWWILFVKQPYRKIKLSFIVATLITTFSTTAFVLMLLLSALYLFYRSGWNFKKASQSQKIILSTMIVIVICGACGFVAYKAFGPNKDSFLIRMGDYTAAFNTWLKHPFFGSGFFNLEEIFKNFPVERSIGNPTAGLLNILAYHGLFLFVFYCIGFGKYLYYATKPVQKIFIPYLILWFFLFLSVPIQYSYITLYLLACGWSLCKKIKLH